MVVFTFGKVDGSIPDSLVHLLDKMEFLIDTDCDRSFESIRQVWSDLSEALEDPAILINGPVEDTDCVWARLSFKNPHLVSQERALYFPKGWKELNCYVQEVGGTFRSSDIGIKHGEETLIVKLPPSGTKTIFIKYPAGFQAYIPLLSVQEMSLDTYQTLRSRSKFKFLLIGALLFPFLFFLVQFIVQKDKLSGYYLLFLAGSGTYLLVILDTMPFFKYAPKIFSSMGLMQRLFVFSTFVTMAGLIKYIHVFLGVRSWSQLLVKMGHILLTVFVVVIMIPILYPVLFEVQYYGGYLQYFRVFALLIFLYILYLTIAGLVKQIKFSKTLMLAFAPLLFTTLLYALSFVVRGGYIWLSIESLVLIAGFLLTLLLFGVVLGVRNNAMKSERLLHQERADRLQAVDQVKTRFYTNITHEFRTPLTVISGMADHILGQKKIKGLIKRNSEQLLNMVNQLLELARIRTDSISIKWVNGDIVPYLQYLTESCQSLAFRGKVSLSFFSKEEAIRMDFDEKMTQQILLNLISNAIKFTPVYGSVKVVAGSNWVGKDSYLEISVQDTGRGIPTHELTRIFDRFYQLDENLLQGEEKEKWHAMTEQGSGIGLALLKELVDLLDGTVKVSSEVGRGSKFVVKLPIHQDADKAFETEFVKIAGITTLDEKDEVETVLTPVSNGGESGEVLIIEDNADVREYILMCLQSKYVLHTARNGKEGIAKARDLVPDLIISDIMMPEMDGLEFCREVKSDRRTSHIPVILLTAKATMEDKISGLEQGADAYLTKPFDKDELLLRLDNLLSLTTRMQQRLTGSLDSSEGLDATEKPEAEFIKEINEVIDTNMTNEMSDTQQLCRSMAMSRTQLHRKLKALTGQATASYIRTIKLRKARMLLEQTDQPIAEVATEVGYKDASHFSKSFMKEFGMLPSQARR